MVEHEERSVIDKDLQPIDEIGYHSQADDLGSCFRKTQSYLTTLAVTFKCNKACDVRRDDSNREVAEAERPILSRQILVKGITLIKKQHTSIYMLYEWHNDARPQGSCFDGQRLRMRAKKCPCEGILVVKNKVSPPFKTAEFDIMYGKGISKEGELIDIASNLGIVKRSGAWFYYGELRMAQGRDNAKIFLSENPELFNEIHQKVLAAMNNNGAIEVEAEATAPEVVQEAKAPSSRISIDVAVDD